MNAPVSSIVLKEKEALKLICSVDKSKDPNTEIEWIRERDNAVVGREEKFIINNVEQNDAGIYYCKARNSDSIVAAIARTEVNIQCK